MKGGHEEGDRCVDPPKCGPYRRQQVDVTEAHSFLAESKRSEDSDAPHEPATDEVSGEDAAEHAEPVRDRLGRELRSASRG